MHYLIGNLGHALVIISFLTALFSAYSYFIATLGGRKEKEWSQNGRLFYFFHLISVLGVVVTLFLIIYNQYYEYYYAWSHSSNNLPTHYMISCFWEGQEGSFLLWIFWNALISIFILRFHKSWESPVMVVFMLVQLFLTSMILGVVIPGINLKIGSSPFILIRDAIEAPIFQMNPEFIPEDGTGLNPLLQNYWMVIHPPTLFLGFSLTLVPFAFCVAGLWKRRFQEWLTPALPWTSITACVLGMGIMMGAYWAYETLSFGGYWNWDPVENAVYVPWLVLIAALHLIMVSKSSKSTYRTAAIMTILAFILILYSTFLTRSGVLGDASVHSFTDLGLSGQLLIYLFVFVIFSVLLLTKRWKEMPTSDKDPSAYSGEFWVFIGATTLALASFQVLIPTSIPVYNRIVEDVFGGISNIAPPTDQIGFYTKFQLWFGVAIALFSALGQFFWWKKIDKTQLKDTLLTPLVITLLLTSLVIALTKTNNPVYITLLFASLFSLVSNSISISRLYRKNLKLSGGAVSHIGIALILIGILFSAGYSKVISLNTTGLLYSKSLPDEMNRENLLLFLHEPRMMNDYKLNFKGRMTDVKGIPDYVRSSTLLPVENGYKALAMKNIEIKGKTYAKAGDTLAIYPENTYYELELTSATGKKYTLYPRAQVNPDMGLIASPDIVKFWDKDLYAHVSSIPKPDEEKEWGGEKEFKLSLSDTFFANDYVAVLERVQRVENIPQVKLTQNDIAVKAFIKILGEEKEYTAEPAMIIQNRMLGKIPFEIEELGLKFTFKNIDPKNGVFTIGIDTTQKDYIILKAILKPHINILWIGTIILIFGFSISAWRRYSEQRV